MKRTRTLAPLDYRHICATLTAMRWLLGLAGALLLVLTPVSSSACPGDCNGTGVVSIDELVTAVRIALAQSPLGACSAADAGGDGRVTVDDLVRAVNAALRGCPPTPTATAVLNSASRTPTASAVLPTMTPDANASATPTVEVTANPTSTPSPEPTGSATATDTPAAEVTATPTLPADVTPTPTEETPATPTVSATATLTTTGSPIVTATASAPATVTAALTATTTAVVSPTATPSGPPTPSGTAAATLTPSASPTASHSPAATASATPTVTATPPNVAGEWREDNYALALTTCDAGINAVIQAQIAQLEQADDCVFTVAQAGTSVTITDCEARQATGNLGTDGVVVIALPMSSVLFEDGCIIVFDPEFRGDLRMSPTTVQQSSQLIFMGACAEVDPCDLTVESRWTRL